MVREAITVNSRLSRDTQQDPTETKKGEGRISKKGGKKKEQKERTRGIGEEISKNK